MVVDSAGWCPEGPSRRGAGSWTSLAGSWAMYLLADFGTEVITVERPASAMTPADGGRRTQPSGVEAT
jgi:hypothetical protein